VGQKKKEEHSGKRKKGSGSKGGLNRKPKKGKRMGGEKKEVSSTFSTSWGNGRNVRRTEACKIRKKKGNTDIKKYTRRKGFCLMSGKPLNGSHVGNKRRRVWDKNN